MSYRPDSDIVCPHGSVQPFEILGNTNVNRNENFGAKYPYLAKKSRVSILKIGILLPFGYIFVSMEFLDFFHF